MHAQHIGHCVRPFPTTGGVIFAQEGGALGGRLMGRFAVLARPPFGQQGAGGFVLEEALKAVGVTAVCSLRYGHDVGRLQQALKRIQAVVVIGFHLRVQISGQAHAPLGGFAVQLRTGVTESGK